MKTCERIAVSMIECHDEIEAYPVLKVYVLQNVAGCEFVFLLDGIHCMSQDCFIFPSSCSICCLQQFFEGRPQIGMNFLV